MIDSEILISVLVFAVVMLFGFGIHLYLNNRRQRGEVIRRIRQIDEKMSMQEKTNLWGTLKAQGLRLIGSLGNLIRPTKGQELSHLRKKLSTAGYRKENAALIFYGLKGFLAVIFFMVSLAAKMWLFRTLTFTQSVSFSILMALIGFYLPGLWLQIRTVMRKEKLRRGLPDALDLMVVCVEAGTGLDAAITRVGEEMKMSNKVLSEEFRLLNLELRAGKQRHEALKNLALRTDLEDVSSLVTILIQTERFGTSIAQALRVHSDSMRTKRYQKAEEIATKLPVKLVFPLLFFIFPALLLVILGPAFISILRSLLPVLKVH